MNFDKQLEQNQQCSFSCIFRVFLCVNLVLAEKQNEKFFRYSSHSYNAFSSDIVLYAQTSIHNSSGAS